MRKLPEQKWQKFLLKHYGWILDANGVNVIKDGKTLHYDFKWDEIYNRIRASIGQKASLTEGETYTVYYATKTEGNERKLAMREQQITLAASDNYIESLMPLNASQLQMKLRNSSYGGHIEVDVDSVQKLSNYTVRDENDKIMPIKNIEYTGWYTVIITLNEPVEPKERLNVAVNDIKFSDSDEGVYDTYVTDIFMNDTRAPSAYTKIKNDGEYFTSIELTFKEIIHNGEWKIYYASETLFDYPGQVVSGTNVGGFIGESGH